MNIYCRDNIKSEMSELLVSHKKSFRGFGPLAKYADRAIAACWQSSANFCG
jgi:hypothetical protein